ncbi:MAG TPA: hypothetical protein VKQ36_03935 [Ktedonobacterales bacterium]|nr:hypothetical protein [Ktedonobacterales bacterium]
MPTERPDPADLNHAGDLEGLPTELRSLDRQLTQDGARWSARLPSTERLAQRLAAQLKEQDGAANSRSSQAPASASLASKTSRASGSPLPRASTSDSPGEIFMRQQPRQPRLLNRFLAGAALVALVALFAAFAIYVTVFHGFGVGAHTGNPTTGSNQGTSSSTPFKVKSVDLSVTPSSIAGDACGSSVTFTYTVTFHIPSGTAGGTIHFQYTLNNGRSSTPASVTVSPGQTTKQYTFTSSGTLPFDHTYPSVAEVMVTSPSSVTSSQVKPTGTCH